MLSGPAVTPPPDDEATITDLQNELADVHARIVATGTGQSFWSPFAGGVTGAVFGLVIAASVSFQSCDPWPMSHEEVARLRSPAGDIDAIVMRSSSGALSDFGYGVILVPAGHSIAHGIEVAGLYGALRDEQTSGVAPRWVSDDVLRIEFMRARYAHLLGPGHAAVSGREVSVSLQGQYDPWPGD